MHGTALLTRSLLMGKGQTCTLIRKSARPHIQRDPELGAGDDVVNSENLSHSSSPVDGLATTFTSNWGAMSRYSTMGNLLVDVPVNSQTANQAQSPRAAETLSPFNTWQRDYISSRYGGTGPNAVTTGLPFTRSTGPVLEFGYTMPTAAVPEPTA